MFRKIAFVFLLTAFILAGTITQEVWAEGVKLDSDDVSLKMNEYEFGKYTTGTVQGVWEPGETVDRFIFNAGENGLYGGLSFDLKRSWARTLDDVRLENTLFAELKSGSYIKIFFDPGDDENTTVSGGPILSRNDEVRKHGGVGQLTGKFIFETKRITNLEKEYTYELTFTFSERANVIRYGGKDRYEVEKNLNSELSNQSLDTILISSGLKYSDTLVGATLNKKKNATILLVNDNDTILGAKIEEAKRLLKPSGKVYLLGGPATVSTKIESAFKKHFSVERIGGKDRLEVALNVAEMANPQPTELFLVYGLVFSDALSVSPVATERQAPILPQWGDKLKSEIKDYVKKHSSIKKVYIVSGTGVVPVSIESELKSIGISEVERIAGKDRFDTSLAIAQKFYPNPLSVSIANGLVFADALSGSRNSWENNSPMVLVKREGVPFNTLQYILNLRRLWFLGGPATLSDDIKVLLTGEDRLETIKF
ncbi:cell wall-binding repeat-containing protein [Cytobacillus oceanisediminis]|uniref:cell wall-binding repeat-containing protein n=1 Tax=Cytobacillus oceanisediminis TaxID=665099 RepID=UPI0011A5BF78|nr:cell wall-binding repeat-containing protein [Cytobacillus oceanisediminis]